MWLYTENPAAPQRRVASKYGDLRICVPNPNGLGESLAATTVVGNTASKSGAAEVSISWSCDINFTLNIRGMIFAQCDPKNTNTLLNCRQKRIAIRQNIGVFLRWTIVGFRDDLQPQLRPNKNIALAAPYDAGEPLNALVRLGLSDGLYLRESGDSWSFLDRSWTYPL